jgi:hypothetical protein
MRIEADLEFGWDPFETFASQVKPLEHLLHLDHFLQSVTRTNKTKRGQDSAQSWTVARSNICGFFGFRISQLHTNSVERYKLLRVIHTKTRHESTKQKVPERPMPAEQWTTGGPTFWSRAPLSRTTIRKLRNAVGLSGTPKSGHVV